MDFDTFVQRLAASELMSVEELNALLADVPATMRPTGGEDLARWLVEQGHLTEYQAQEVDRGRSKGLVLGNYVVLDRIGAGGMGQVFKARHRRMKRVVALKVLPDDMAKDSALIARFEREVQAAAKLMHPNIVTAFDADEAYGIVFLVMEYVRGEDLASVVRSRGPLSVGQAVECVLDAARGLEYAHQNGVIHRDIKPSNLLWSMVRRPSSVAGNSSTSAQRTKNAGQRTVKILDMGLARIEDASADVATQAELTGTGMVMGTVDYMAPEQALSAKNADQRSDIYSLGVTLHYLLTGKPAYAGDSVIQRFVGHRESPVPSLRAVRPEVPAALDELFAKMLAKRPEDRCQSMSEVVTALEEIAAASGVRQSGDATVVEGPGFEADTSLDSFLSGLRDDGGATAADISAGPTRVDTEPDDFIAETFLTQVEDPTATVIRPRVDESAVVPSRVGVRRKSKWFWLSMVGGGLAMLGCVAFVLWRRSVPDRPPVSSVVQSPARSQTSEPLADEPSESPQEPEPAAEPKSLVEAVPVLYGPNGLRFSEAGGIIHMPELGMDFGEPFTVEFWVDIDEGLELDAEQAYLCKVSSTFYFKTYHPTRQLVAGAYDPKSDVFMQSVVPFDDLPRGPFHTALQWDGEQISLTVNGAIGQPHVSEDLKQCPDEAIEMIRDKVRKSGYDVIIGSKVGPNSSAFPGTIYAFRLSRGARYSGAFTPGRLESDEMTEVLYDFHEGSGITLHDVSGHGHDGKIVDGEWVDGSNRVEEPNRP